MPHALHRTIALVLFACFLLTGCDKRADEVRDTFDRYQDAVAERDADKVFKLLCRDNVERYTPYAQLVRDGTKDQILSLPTIQQIDILALRHVTTAADVRNADAKEVVRLAIDRGLWSSDDSVRFNLIDLKVAKSSAFAKLEFDDIELPIEMTFALEDGVWKVDATAMERKLNKLLKDLGQNAKVSKEDLVLNMVERTTKKPVDISLWNPKK